MNFLNFYNSYQNRINKKLYDTLNNLPFQHSILIKAMKYATLVGGKRLRSYLIYTIGEIFKTNIITLDAISISVELIHAYSLIHDDLPSIDNDNYRRGRFSCHIKYGESFAILAGDALQSLAFNILSTYNMPGVSNKTRLKLISELSNAIGSSGMCLGQTLDLKKNNKNSLDISELEKINLYKTAFLIRSSVRLSYLSSPIFSKKIQLLLDRFSIFIGLAFQIQDDIFDFKNDIKKLKNKNSKIQNIHPSLIGIKESQKKIQTLYKKALSILKILEKKCFVINKLEFLTNLIIKSSMSI
ncbi:Farnesyl diphosphate synthase [Buchnera aphidicola (Protaphis terricola)]|uniref:polyprenyl synthetase family protein n=1 Tax=Buchnera aphidicola TaxID=9 RepID=UPI003464710B